MDKPNFNLREIEKQTILRCLEYHRGHRNATCESLGISIRCLRNKLIKYDKADYLKFHYKMSKSRKKYLKNLSKRRSEE